MADSNGRGRAPGPSQSNLIRPNPTSAATEPAGEVGGLSQRAGNSGIRSGDVGFCLSHFDPTDHNRVVNILDRIVGQKQLEVAALPERRIAAGDLRDALLERGERRDFAAALRAPRHGDVALIAEVKKASPSAGVICKDFDPVRIARQYEAAGASCLSVLTDEKFFQGSLEYLRQIRAAVSLPLLRKDFIIDERQILEAIEWGADAILLIVAILDDARLKHFHQLAREAGLAVLVEVHDETELERAVAIGASLIGVNNRNLKTFSVDLATTERLAAKLFTEAESQEKYLLVAESGIRNRADVQRLIQCGAKAILVGESLVKDPQMQDKVKALIQG